MGPDIGSLGARQVARFNDEEWITLYRVGDGANDKAYYIACRVSDQLPALCHLILIDDPLRAPFKKLTEQQAEAARKEDE